MGKSKLSQPPESTHHKLDFSLAHAYDNTLTTEGENKKERKKAKTES